ncbi:MAG: 16S rRNA (adenine(1518)-N(6)/adenine(1519)-N(6))-dimethyltransferase RsmA [Clostridia bacterium]
MDSVKDSLQKHNFRFNKAFGQNFISDINLLSAIVEDAGITENDTVVEVGAGAGTLTRAIAEKAKRVISYEIDENLKPILSERLGDLKNLEIRFKDIMKVDQAEIDEIGAFKVVANLPYYITTPVTMFFLEECKAAQSVTIMVQKEVAERFIAKAGTAEYGAITVAVDFYGEASIKRPVNRKMFFPVPNVDSSVLHIDLRQKYFPDNEKLFLKTIKIAFSMRRKTLSNNLLSGFSLPRETVDGVIERAGFDKAIRGERLTTSDFVKLSNEINKVIL